MSVMPGQDTSAEQVVEALRLRALTALIYADMVNERDKGTAAQARETATLLRCQAAVIEAMSALYDELGMAADRWGEFAERMRHITYRL